VVVDIGSGVVEVRYCNEEGNKNNEVALMCRSDQTNTPTDCHCSDWPLLMGSWFR
jgi:hypothetical protein